MKLNVMKPQFHDLSKIGHETDMHQGLSHAAMGRDLKAHTQWKEDRLPDSWRNGNIEIRKQTTQLHGQTSRSWWVDTLICSDWVHLREEVLILVLSTRKILSTTEDIIYGSRYYLRQILSTTRHIVDLRVLYQYCMYVLGTNCIPPHCEMCPLDTSLCRTVENSYLSSIDIIVVR